jgi:hypothetical protein
MIGDAPDGSMMEAFASAALAAVGTGGCLPGVAACVVSDLGLRSGRVLELGVGMR